jgi:hypothetical protein
MNSATQMLMLGFSVTGLEDSVLNPSIIWYFHLYGSYVFHKAGHVMLFSHESSNALFDY